MKTREFARQVLLLQERLIKIAPVAASMSQPMASITVHHVPNLHMLDDWVVEATLLNAGHNTARVYLTASNNGITLFGNEELLLDGNERVEEK